MEGILHALSDPVRASIFAEIAGSDCSQSCSSFLTVSAKAVPKSTLSHHFKVLREAGLIRSERSGIEVRNSSRCEEIDARFPGLLHSVLSAYRIQLGGATAIPG